MTVLETGAVLPVLVRRVLLQQESHAVRLLHQPSPLPCQFDNAECHTGPESAATELLIVTLLTLYALVSHRMT